MRTSLRAEQRVAPSPLNLVGSIFANEHRKTVPCRPEFLSNTANGAYFGPRRLMSYLHRAVRPPLGGISTRFFASVSRSPFAKPDSSRGNVDPRCASDLARVSACLKYSPQGHRSCEWTSQSPYQSGMTPTFRKSSRKLTAC